MSVIKGKQREVTEDFVKKVGLFEATVITINPTLKEYEDILGFTPKNDQKEFEYTGISRDNNSYLRVDVWIKATNSEDKFKIVFFLEDKIRMNKDETKTQYINNIGNCSWAEDAALLPAWFAGREYREAKNGEEDFYNFLRIWLGGLDYRDDETELQLDWQELMKGDVSSIKEQIGGNFSVPFIPLATIVTKTKENVEGEEETIEYQGIYNRQFMPFYCMKHFKTTDYNDDETIAKIQDMDIKKMKFHEKFIYNVTGEYGCNDYYKLSELEEYNKEDNPVNTEETKLSEEASSEY